MFNDIRDLFAKTADAKARGYNGQPFLLQCQGAAAVRPARGDGLLKIEMHFLPDVYVPLRCVQRGRRYNKETLEVRYKGKNIYEVLDMTVDEACEFFANVPKIARRLETMRSVSAMSSWSSPPRRCPAVKRSAPGWRPSCPNARPARPSILDEPTTGLHVADVHRLVDVLQKLVDAGNTVVVIEHNLDVIKTADYIRPRSRAAMAAADWSSAGTPEEVAQCKGSYTGQYLGPILARKRNGGKREQ